MQPGPTFRGPRTLLRAITPGDRAALAAILAEPAVTRWWIHGDLESTVAGLYNEASGVRLTIEVDGEVVGYIQFSEDLDPDYRHASIDLFVSTAWQGRGIGPEAIRLVAGHLFEERGHHRITIDPAVTNEHAIRAYEKVGFRPIGTMRRYERGADGTWHDGMLMDLLAKDLR
jgi:aminoglycoside 6'-N-acetyltransferase